MNVCRTLRTVLPLGALLITAFATADENPPPQTHDGLQLVQERKVALAYVDPDADFSVYDKFLILEASVAFKKNWRRDHRSATAKDMERIKADMAKLFRETFVETLSEDGGYEIVNEAGEGVLLLRPAIIDLDVTAPDTMSAGRSYTFASQAGQATLFIELYDSVTGDILARAVDRRATRDNITMQWATRASNRADAKALMKQWATLLREAMDDVRKDSD